MARLRPLDSKQQGHLIGKRPNNLFNVAQVVDHRARNIEFIKLRTAVDRTHEMAAPLAEPATMSWPMWAAHHWVASILAHGAICNVLVFYHLERDRWLRRATAPPRAAETRPEVVRSYLAAVLAQGGGAGGASRSDAACLAEQWPFGSMEETEKAEAVWFHTVFGETRGGLLHQRLHADVARRRGSSPRDVSSKPLSPASIFVGRSINCFHMC